MEKSSRLVTDFLFQICDKKKLHITHAYVTLAADVHLAGFAPAFSLSFHDSERSRKPPNAHSLGRYVQQQKMKKSDFVS